MQTTPKANNSLGHFFALLGAVVMLAIGTWVGASSSEQVKPLDNLAVSRTGHTATALSDGSILITGGRDTDGNLVAASEIFDPETQTSSASAVHDQCDAEPGRCAEQLQHHLQHSALHDRSEGCVGDAECGEQDIWRCRPGV